ncbi:23S rRNA (uracil(1939)-C(5))-methyltransferase RlmD [bacterium]|nr:23S rRNA (uracil(1939)-C(5))-methyltransferase RlmD [bacterium]
MGRRNKQRNFERVELLAGGGEGHAIAKVNGKVIFVKYGAPGDVVDIKVVGRKKRFDLANITEIHEASKDRTEPFCQHYGTCGGCKWQHLDYAAQLRLKDQWTRDCMQRIGKIEPQEYIDILPAASTEFYRNKMEYTFSNKRWLYEDENLEDLDHTNALGFHAPGRFDKVLAIEKCWLQHDHGNKIRNFVRDYALEHGLSFYDLKEHTGLLRNLMLRNTRNGDWMINLIVAEDDPYSFMPLLEAIKNEFDPYTLNYSINTKLNDSIYDLDFINYSGSGFLWETLFDLEFEIHPKSFFQTNTVQAEKLYQVGLDFAELKGTEVVYDLYCGTGTISLVAARKAKKVIGVEIIQEAIDSANSNAKHNKIDNSVFVCGDMKDVFHDEFYNQHGAPDIIITDPPRSGMHPKVVQQLLSIACPKIVYISCNPATQARDLEVLSEKYDVLKSQAVDMFPHTHHVENVTLLKLR